MTQASSTNTELSVSSFSDFGPLEGFSFFSVCLVPGFPGHRNRGAIFVDELYFKTYSHLRAFVLHPENFLANFSQV